MRIAIAVVVVLAFPVFGAAQTTRYVPDHYPTIQEAINGSADGDTLIDGNQAGSVVTFVSGEEAGSTLEGFTITNGSTDFGGGICCWSSSSPTLANMILWDNNAQRGPEICVGEPSYPSHPMISYSDVQGGQAAVHAEPGSVLNWGPGMIDSEPLFVDPANADLHLTQLSPCINRGTNAGAPPKDLDGDARPCMGTVDMGADEYTGVHTLSARGFALSQSTGGMIPLSLQAGSGHGNHGYCILGTRSGTAPGQALPGGEATLPINFDEFTDIVLNGLNVPYFDYFLGVLDGKGKGAATLH